jgi:dTDP-4-amino-4,6-dideoxygalactose transaminase
MNDSYIPFHAISLGEEEINEVVATLRSGWLTTGPKTAQFEEEFRAYVGSRCSLAVNSGTAGLHLMVKSLEIGPGDEVITTPMTFCATVNIIMQCGATPVLADIGPDGNIDPASVAERITGSTRCLLPVHLGGLPCDMDALWALARRHNLFVVEDAAHAAGSRYNGTLVGAVDAHSGAASDGVVFSFYATKNLTTGEGGMVTTQNDVLNERMRILCLHGITRDAWGRYGRNGSWAYDVVECGFKYNLTDIQSALGIHQLRRLEANQEIRTRYAAIYNEAFAGVEELECAPGHKLHGHSWHLYALRLNLDKLSFQSRCTRSTPRWRAWSVTTARGPSNSTRA